MKKYLIIALVLIVLFGCKKNPFDYRTKYFGDYNFAIHKTTWTILGQTTDTTYNSTGIVDYSEENNTILISFSENVFSEFTIYEDGTLDQCQCNQTPSSFASGEFESSKKIRISYGYGGLGARTNYGITGEKNK